MRFEDWWQYHGQRNLAFDAKQWALAGWRGHELHAGEVIDADVPLLEDVHENADVHDPVNASPEIEIGTQWLSTDGFVLREWNGSEWAVISPLENKEKK